MYKRIVFAALIGLSRIAGAAPANHTYHFELSAVTTKSGVDPEFAAIAQDRVEQQVRKALASHPRLLASVPGAPDPKTSPEAYRKFLTKKAISGSYRVSVEVTEASQEIALDEGRPNSRRAVVRVGIHVLGETIPGQTIGFTGEGHATVKIEIGAKLRDRDRDFAWDSAAETAIDDALKTCFAKLAPAGTRKR